MTSEALLLKNVFKSRHIILSIEFIDSFITWCKQEDDLPQNYTTKHLEEKVYHQWLIQDLCSLDVAVLPPNLSQETKYILNGTYCLQVMKITDISKPKLWQLQRIRNKMKNVDPFDNNEFGKRVLEITLTDGVQEVEAMEFKPVPCLSLNLTPGVKIKLTGPVTVRRGRIMLESNHVKVLGGEVDDLLVENAAENVLAKALNLPLNPRPTVISDTVLNSEKNKDENTYTQNVGQFHLNKIQEKTNTIGSVPIRVNVNQIQTIGFPDEDDDDFNIDENELIEAERAMQANYRQCPSPDLFGSDIELQEITNEIDEVVIEPNTNTDNVYSSSRPCSIKAVLNMRSNSSDQKYVIRGKFVEVCEKLKLINDKYHLVIRITDGSDTIKVKLHADVICDLAESSETQLLSFRERIINQDAQAREQLFEILGRMKWKLEQLDTKMEIIRCENENYEFILLKLIDT